MHVKPGTPFQPFVDLRVFVADMMWMSSSAGR